MNWFIIIVAGVPGTGKTVLSQKLSDILECSYYSSSNLLKKLGLAKPDPTGRYTLIVDDQSVEKAYKSIKDESKCVILETVYPALWISIAEEDIPVIVLLRTEPRTLLKRLIARDWPREKIAENVLAEALGSIALELLEWRDMVIEIDTSNIDSSKIIEIFFMKLEEWDTGIRIDWLSNPSISEFLKEVESWINFDKYWLRDTWRL